MSCLALSSLPGLGLHGAVVLLAGEVDHAHPVDGPAVSLRLPGRGQLLVAAEEGVDPLRDCGLPPRSSSALVTLLRDIPVIRVLVPLLLLDVGGLLSLGVSLMIILVTFEAQVQTRGLARLLGLTEVRAAGLAWAEIMISRGRGEERVCKGLRWGAGDWLHMYISKSHNV